MKRTIKTILLFLSIPILSFANLKTVEKEVTQLLIESSFLRRDAEINYIDEIYLNARIEAFQDVLEIIEKIERDDGNRTTKIFRENRS